MRLHRFYVKEDLAKGKDIRIESPELLHQWTKVFRLTSSDRIVLFNGNGKEFEGYFKILSRNEAVIAVDKEIPRGGTLGIKKGSTSGNLELHIFQGIIKKDNFELIVEKCTELGVTAIHPVLAERSEKKDLNMERLRKISTEASEQSGRVELPEIFEPTDLEIAVENFDGEIFALDFDGESLRAKRSNPDLKLGILIGPEGGWTENERDFFEHKKIKSFSLGSQILRAETAAIAVSSIILLK